MKSNIALMKSNEAADETRDNPGHLIDKDTPHIIHLIDAQSNPQLQLMLKNLNIGF